MESVIADFGCDSCGKRFRWNNALAGRRVKCACGNIFRCPESAPADEYDLAPAMADVVMHRAAALAPDTSPTIGYESVTPAKIADAKAKNLMTIYVPLWLLVGGVVIQVVAAWLILRNTFISDSQLLDGIIRSVGVNILAGTALNLAGVMVAAKLRGIDLGNFWTAILRLAAISVAPRAFIYLLWPFFMHIPLLGPILALAALFIAFFSLLGALFDLDQEETWTCVCVIFVVTIANWYVQWKTGWAI